MMNYCGYNKYERIPFVKLFTLVEAADMFLLIQSYVHCFSFFVVCFAATKKYF